MTKNITVTVPEETYRQARVWAAERDTSISAVVAYLLESLPRPPPRRTRFSRPACTRVNPADPCRQPRARRSARTIYRKNAVVKL